MRHVGKELGFVLAGQFEILGLLFDFQPGSIQLFVLAADRIALFLKGFCPLFQFLVCDAQLLLLGLQLRFRNLQRLGLLLQLFIRDLEFLLLRLQLFVRDLELLLLGLQLFSLLLGLFEQLPHLYPRIG